MTTFDETLDLNTDQPDLTPGGALFTVPGATDAVTQWRVFEIQLINWGGFGAPVTVPFDYSSTLVSGMSGSGKSTLLDAYTAVMMPSDVAFNGASNEAAGRARGEEQRSIVSYVRGQTDVITSEDGEDVARVLRGKKSAAWGGAAVVFVNDRREKFTAARVFYVPASARTASESTMRMMVLDGHLTLRDLEPLAAEAFPPQKMRNAVTGLSTFDTYVSFSARLSTRLGIGANGDGDKALQLLAFVQAGGNFRSVDQLYKISVLEKPSTFDTADKALAHFDHLADTYRTMQDEHRKESILRHIHEDKATLDGARATASRIEALGHRTPGATPMAVWENNLTADLLGHAEAAAFASYQGAKSALADAELAANAADVAVDRARDEFNAAGGADSDALERAVKEADFDIASRSSTLSRLVDDVEIILDPGMDLTDRGTFESLHAVATSALADMETQRRNIGNALSEAQIELRDIKVRHQEAVGEVAFLEKSGTRIPEYLDGLRRQVCERAGLDVEKAPFLAELVAVKTDESAWGAAIEKVLGPAASRMLVPDDMLDDFQTVVNDLRLTAELRFDGAGEHLPEPSPAPANTTAGKLDFAEGPYRGWAMRRVATDAYNAICVDHPSELGHGGFRVTKEGQTRRGRAGSLGARAGRPILGFTNKSDVKEAKAKVAALAQRVADAQERVESLAVQFDNMDHRRDAYRDVARVDFTSIDVREARSRYEEKKAAYDLHLQGNADLNSARSALEDAKIVHTGTLKAVALLGEQCTARKADWSGFQERRDTATRTQEEWQAHARDMLDEETAAYLNEQYANLVADADSEDVAALPGRMSALRRFFTDEHGTANTTVERAKAALVSAFEQYLDQFFDPKLSPSLDAYPDFATILDEINQRGLRERREAWRMRLMEWSGEHLFMLHQEMDSALADIESRMLPINQILSGLPFGPTDGRLQMKPRRIVRDEVTRFRARLKALSSGATLALEDHQMEAKFKELEEFMALLRSPKDERFDPRKSRRFDLLDVRKHVEVLAECFGRSGKREATYKTLGNKSGGETQELIAFIIGAALRFRLGDENRERPRFAPVFLDEGFIKADAQFTSRAVKAWDGLGFQIIVGAPMDKYGALEPHMNLFMMVSKKQSTKKSRIRVVEDAERASMRAKWVADAAADAE